jgi:hypothetical protein
MRVISIFLKAAMTAVMALIVLTLVGCASFHPLPPVVLQQGDADCAIATVAMASHRTYAQVVADAKAVGIDISLGVSPLQMTRLLQQAHLETTVPASPDLGASEGVLVIRMPEGVHAVYVHRGWVLDPNSATQYPWQFLPGEPVVYYQIVRGRRQP